MDGCFEEQLDSVIPGVCSIDTAGSRWVVCPRRLLGFVNKENGIPSVNESLHAHEREALVKAGLPTGVELGVWPEVYLKYEDDDASINYHFDFVVSPIRRNVGLGDVSQQFGLTDEETRDFVRASKKGGYLMGRATPDSVLPIVPVLDSPWIIEVMTASTSGSDTSAGTDIASAFVKAIRNEDYACPGINKRQVWGRMATQLFSKSALAAEWGGKTIWLVQDQLLKNIELTTKLTLSASKPDGRSSINFLSLKFQESALCFDLYSEKPAGLDFSGSNACTDILLAKRNPSLKVLLTAMIRRPLSAILIL